MTSRALLAAAVFATLQASPLLAGTPATYTGPTGGAYHAPGNWSGGVVPNNSGGTTYDAIIDAAAGAVTVQLNGSAAVDTLMISTGDGLVIQDNRGLTIANGTLSNSGLLSLASAGNATDLFFSIDTALSGNGTLSLSNTLANRIYGNAGAVLTTSNLITGAGQLGLNTLAITNNHVITASSTAGLRIDPTDGGSSFTNNGTLRANGGTLLLQAGTYTGGVIEALDGSIVQMDTGSLVQAALLKSDASAAGVALRGTLLNSTSSGSLFVSDNSGGAIQGSLHNTGTLSLRSAGNNTDLIVSASTTLSGGGTLSLSNTLANRLFGVAGASFVTDNVITGAGQLGLNFLVITNTGTIIASGSQGLNIDPADGPDGFTNAGTLRADGGPIRLSNGAFTNSGLIEARNGSAVLIQGGAVVTGGTLTTDANPNSAIVLMGQGTVAGITNTGTLQIPDNNMGILSGTINNLSLIRMLSGGNNTDLFLAEDGTLLGGGTLSISNAAANRVYGNAGVRLTNHNVITGAGQLGINFISFTNYNLIVATSSAGFTIDPADVADGFINNGTLRADGGNVSLVHGTFTNNNTIEALNGSAVIIGSGAVVTGGTLTTNHPSSAVTLANGVIHNVTNAGLLQIPDNTTGTLRGTLTNNALFRMSSAGNHTNLVIDGDVTLAGAGTLSLSNTPANRIFGNVGNRFTNHGLISGAGQLGVNFIGFTNNNLIVASSTGGILLDPDDAAGVTNNGTLRADGGNMTLTGGTFSNNGLIEAHNGSFVFLGTGATINGGTLTTNSAASAVSFASGIVNGVTNTGILEIPDNRTGTLRGTLTNNGLFRLGSVGNNTDLLIDGTVTLTGGGTLAMSNTQANRIYSNNAGRLINSGRIVGAGQLGVNLLSVTNTGSITATLAAAINIDPADGPDGFINNGVLRADGGPLQLLPGPFNNTGGLIEALNGSQVRVTSNAVVSGGTLTSDANPLSAVTLHAGTLQDLRNTGLVLIPDNNSGFVQGTIQNAGTIGLRSAGNNTDLVINGNTTITGGGSITFTNTQANRIHGAANSLLTNANTIVGAAQLGVNLLRINNTGQIIASGTAGMSIDPVDTSNGFTSTGLLRADGTTMTFHPSTYTLGGAIEAVNGGVLNFSAGNFTFSSPVTLNNGTVQFNAVGISAKGVVGTGTVVVGVGGSVTSDAVQHTGPWQIAGTHTIRAGAGNAGTSRISVVPAVDPNSGRLDLADSALVVDTSSGADKLAKIAALNARLLAGQGGVTWTGRGITSAAAAANPTNLGVGIFDNADLNRASIGGATLNGDSLFLMIAHYGDGTFDGKVDAFDLNLLAANWQRASGATWTDGDFTYDGKVDAFDLNVLAAHWQFGTAGSLEAALALFPQLFGAGGGLAAVPEPATLSLLALAGPLLLRRRARRAPQRR